MNPGNAWPILLSLVRLFFHSLSNCFVISFLGMRSTLQAIEYTTSQAASLRSLLGNVLALREEQIKSFRRQVVSTLYQDVPGFKRAFSDEESVQYLRELFEVGILTAVPANLPLLVGLTRFASLSIRVKFPCVLAYPRTYLFEDGDL
jgi:hypothetical protein